MVYLALANAYQQMDDYHGTREAFETLIQLGQMAGNSVSELLGVSGLALLALQHGEYHFAYQIVTQGLERVERSGSLPPISTALFGELAVIHYQWHQLEQAHHYFQRAIRVGYLSGYSDAELYYGVILSRLFQIQGDLETAAEKIQNAVDLMQVEAPSAVREEVIAQQVRIHLAQGNLGAAEKVLEGQGFAFRDQLVFPGLEVAHKVPLFSRDKITRSVWVLYASALRVLLHRAQTGGNHKYLGAGIELADRLIESTLAGGYVPLGLEMLLVRAQLHAVRGDQGSSQRDIIQALRLGQPEGLISIFVEEGAPIAGVLRTLLDGDRLGDTEAEYLHTILAAFPAERMPEAHPDSQALPGMEAIVEPLSKRELEILRLIGEGYANQEIAERLVVTLHTVKKHSSNIYAKLGVSSRTQAVAKGRQLKLL
jgi:LuxR family maltose regulon positive regulatory protein